MASEKVVNYLKAFLTPAQVYGTPMHPSVLLMCKIFVIILYAHGFYGSITDPYIPFLRSLDVLNDYSGIFEYTLKTVFLMTSVLLLFNVKVRTNAKIIAVIVFVAILASKPIFRNHLFIIGCALLLAGLSNNKEKPWLIYYQLSLVYFGALLNKVMQVDWWTGQFMHNWLSNALGNTIYDSAASIFPGMLLAKVLAYSAMLAELIIAICILVPRLRFYGVCVILIFHTLLFTFTGETFGYFMEDILILLIAFALWPRDRFTLSFKPSTFSNILARMVKLFDFDNRISIKCSSEQASRYSVNIEGEVYTNRLAIIKVLLYTSGFYFLILLAEMLIRYLFNDTPKYVALLILFWILLIALAPILFQKLKARKLRRINTAIDG